MRILVVDDQPLIVDDILDELKGIVPEAECVGTYALMTAAVIYHAIYNLLVQSGFIYLGILLPILTYIPAILFLRRSLGHKIFTEGEA